MKFFYTELILNELKQQIINAAQISIVTHVNPDGDALGSSLGMYLVLSKYNKNVNVLTPNKFPHYYQWLPKSSEVIVFEDNRETGKNVIENSDLVFCLDFNSLSRLSALGQFVQNSKATKILIDHHPMPENAFQYIFSDIAVSSTCELAMQFCKHAGLSEAIDKEAAECFFTGIMTDTGMFNFNCSSPTTFLIAAELLAYNVDKEKITRNIFDNYSEQRLRLLGYVLNEKMIVNHQLKAAYFSLSKEEMERFDYQIGDSEGFVNFPLSIKGIVFSTFIMEKDDKVKFSFRSRGSFDVNLFARKYYNGGGHKNAAGGKIYKQLNEAVADFEKYLKEYENDLANSL